MNSTDYIAVLRASLKEEVVQEALTSFVVIALMVFRLSCNLQTILLASQHHTAGTPVKAWVLFTLIFIVETVVVAFYRPRTIELVNATHQQFEFGICMLLLSPVICSIIAYFQSLQAEDIATASKSRRYGFVAWLLSTCVGLLLSFLSKSSVLLGLSVTVPLMVACHSVAIPIWSRNGYNFWIPFNESAIRFGNHQAPGR